jgi:capsular polysaccharide biosynthesis protein
LESALQESGVDVVYPEEMTLFDQILLWNTRRTIIGCWGSAFHGMFFSLNARDLGQKTFIIYNSVHSHYFAIDRLVGMNGHYLHCMQDVDALTAGTPRASLLIDIEFVRRCLHHHNVI